MAGEDKGGSIRPVGRMRDEECLGLMCNESALVAVAVGYAGAEHVFF